MMVVDKGQRASLAQNETSLLVAAGQAAFAAGTLLKRNTDGEWEIAGASDAGDATHAGPPLYIALLDSSNLTARYAGGQNGHISADDEQASIPALPLAESRSIITNVVTGMSDLTITQKLTVGADGKFVAHSSNQTVYATVTRGMFDHFDPLLVVTAGFRTGGDVDAVMVETCYLPQIATA